MTLNLTLKLARIHFLKVKNKFNYIYNDEKYNLS